MLRRLSVGLVALLLVLAGCGDDGAEPDDSSTADAEEPSADEGEGEGADDEEADEEEGDEEEASDDSEVAEFYDGNTIEIIVGYGPGGGFDTYARLIAQHMGEYVPGNPDIVVENMEGAGSLIAANHIFNAAPQDGTAIGVSHGVLILQDALGHSDTDFTATEQRWLGAPVTDTSSCIASAESGFSSIEQALVDGEDREIVFGGTGLDYQQNALMLALDINARIVTGYDGTGEIKLGVMQGEVDATCTGWESFKSTWSEELASGEAVMIAQMGREPHPELEGIVHVEELIETEDERNILDYGIRLPGTTARAWSLPPNVPEDRVAALQDAFAQALEDPELLAEAEAQELDINYLSADDAEESIASLYEMPDDIVELLRPLVLVEE